MKSSSQAQLMTAATGAAADAVAAAGADVQQSWKVLHSLVGKESRQRVAWVRTGKRVVAVG